jgi:hypothetical protein
MMHSVSVDVFFSCSFAAADRPVNDYFMSIARALNLHLSNVATGSTLIPPEAAKKLIGSAQALIAICTRRDEFKSGGYAMPQAVHDEISFAYGAGVPVLMIVEEGVELAGFKGNFGTYLPFQRRSLKSPAFLQKAIESIHELKLGVVEPHQLGLNNGISDSHSEYVNHQVELSCRDGEFLWIYNTAKKLTYTKASKRGYSASVWATIPANLPSKATDIEWELRTVNTSRNIEIRPKIENRTPEKVDVMITLVPTAEEGDFVEYETTAKSRYINPVWSDEVGSGGDVHLDGEDFKCADGLILIHPTKRAIIEFRFAREYGFKKNDVRPFVASYTSSIDYEVPSELKRANIVVEDLWGTLVVRMELESPLPGHMYGIAWNPRTRPAAPAGGAGA